jgi:hypothetical protein
VPLFSTTRISQLSCLYCSVRLSVSATVTNASEADSGLERSGGVISGAVYLPVHEAADKINNDNRAKQTTFLI